MDIEIKPASQLTPRDRDQLAAIYASSFTPGEEDFAWSDTDWHVLVREGERLVSNVEIVERNAKVDGQPLRLGGIGGVATLPEWRRRGYAEAGLKIAECFLRKKLAVDFGLLICSYQLIPYYGRLGWQVVPGPMLIDQPSGKVQYTNTIMVLPVGRSDWPQGTLDLCGRPW
jgi:aminoglycoside 2'-N-acetyltransferase I